MGESVRRDLDAPNSTLKEEWAPQKEVKVARQRGAPCARPLLTAVEMGMGRRKDTGAFIKRAFELSSRWRENRGRRNRTEEIRAITPNRVLIDAATKSTR